jgi:flap endonuclease-1
MGVDLKSIMVKDSIQLDELGNKVITIDASNILHQFLSTIRQSDGSPMTDSKGNITSHLIGLFYRTLKLRRDFSVKPVYVFDGEMPNFKTEEVEKRAKQRRIAEKKWEEAKEGGKKEEAFRQAVRAGVLSEQMIIDAKTLLRHMGVPYVQAPGEAEAQCAYMTRDESVLAMNSRDYDSLLFGAQRLLRYLTISNKENIELIDLEDFLNHHDISLHQLVDIGILIGTDYNEGIYGVGPKTSLKLIKKYGRIEDIPENYREKLDEDYVMIRKLFHEPPIAGNYRIEFNEPDKRNLVKFLCRERGFPKKRVINNLEK